MIENTAFLKLESKILDGSLFDEKTDVVALAKENGFQVYNADMDDADGFITVDDNQVIPMFGSNRVIGVNAWKDVKRKKAIIAQELGRYYAQKQSDPDIKLKYTLRDTAILNKENFEENVLKKSGIPLKTALKSDENIEKARTNAKKYFDTVLSVPDIAVKTKDAIETDLNESKEVSKYKKSRVDDEKELEKHCFQTDIQIKREEDISTLFKGYVEIFVKREKQRSKYRGWLFGFCICTAFGIIVASLIMLSIWLPIIAGQYRATPTPSPTTTVTDVPPAPSTEGFRIERLLFSVAEAAENGEDEANSGTINDSDSLGNDNLGEIKDYIDSALASNSSIAAKDIVAIISICVTILGSIFVLLRMIAKYVLPADEEKSMQEIVKLIQENDFKHWIVRLLWESKEYDSIVTYLNQPKTIENPADPNKKASAQQT